MTGLFNHKKNKDMTTKIEQIEKAANHFVELYSEEIQNGEEITSDAINEWFIQSVDQYSELTRDDEDAIEKAIYSKI